MCKLQDIREAQDYIQAERSDAGTLALLNGQLHRLQVNDTALPSFFLLLPPSSSFFLLLPPSSFFPTSPASSINLNRVRAVKILFLQRIPKISGDSFIFCLSLISGSYINSYRIVSLWFSHQRVCNVLKTGIMVPFFIPFHQTTRRLQPS